MRRSAFGYDSPQLSPGLLLWQTTTLWQKKLQSSLDDANLTHSQFVILAVCGWFAEKKNSATQNEISKMSKLDKMTVSKALRALEKARFVTRQEHELDSRAKVVKLTKEGVKQIRQVVPIVESIDENFFSCLKASARESLLNSFQEIVKVQSE